MIKRQLSQGKNVKRLILAVPAYLDTEQLDRVRIAARNAVDQTSNLPYPIAIVRESMAIALDYRQINKKALSE